MKIILNESTVNLLTENESINEIATTKNSKSKIPSRSSNVYFGKNVVKKVSKGRFSEVEINAMKVMAENPQYFAKTKIVNERLAYQEKLNTSDLIDVLNDLELEFYQNCRKNYNGLDTLFNTIVENGITPQIKDHINCLKSTLSPELNVEFAKFIKLFINVHPIYKSNVNLFFNHKPDLHKHNLGYDNNKNIKIFDFINPLFF